MPQTLNPEWTQMLGPDAERIHAECLHRPGNLTLSAYNQELWNHPFPTKSQRYAQSNIVLARELADYPRWGEAEVDRRGRQLAAEAAAIWSGKKEPVAAVVEQDDEEETVGRRELRTQFWTGLAEDERDSLNGQLAPAGCDRSAHPRGWAETFGRRAAA